MIVLAYAYFFIARKYLRTSRELKRLESVTRSPIFSHFGEALQGASTIRAYSSQERFLNENHARVDTNHRAFFFVWVANRWLALRVEMVGSLVAFSTAYSIVFLTKYNHGMDAGLAGLSLSYSLAFVEALLWIVRMHALMEMEMNAVERIDEYLHAEQEPASVVDSYRPHENVRSFGSYFRWRLS